MATRAGSEKTTRPRVVHRPMVMEKDPVHNREENLAKARSRPSRRPSATSGPPTQLYNKPDQIESFVRENPAHLTSNDLEIVSSWSNFLKDRFYVVRHLKNSTLFLSHESPPKAYAVLGLNSTLPDLVGSDLPILVDAVLLPYKDKIIYDGTLGSYKLSFGPGMRKSINDAFYQAKASYGIITSLPPPPVKAPTDSERLKGFLKSEYSRDVHYEEIKEIIQNNPELMSVFSQEMGRVHARAFRKRMKEMGLKEGWFEVTGRG